MIVLLVFPCALSAAENAALDEVIQVEHDESGVPAYIKRGDRLEIVPVPLEIITYQFCHEEQL